ncbi:cytochrome c1 [Sneathiella sp. P13V-1]|uniref:cytochrome c1 n=1 Tax=Sneathiella sp. P13V-1 TaxID=2697366 RepID=UPI00187B5B47|nr:cytochrome c1 [Sneathiella sp. P13V-1]MBE7638091.1 cytochrome c1 [Sneathiella sp. P13V-1]
MLKLIKSLSAAALLSVMTFTGAQAAGAAIDYKSVDWKHTGIFGTYDREAAQRGLQVYREVCAGCHGLNQVAFRTLQDLGFSEAEVKAIAAEYEFVDGPDDEGEMFTRPGKTFDKFPDPFANEKAARASNGGAYPPDLSLMVKARPGFENYMYSLMTGYTDAPADFEVPEGMNYNAYFAGHNIAMPAPLAEDGVEYSDGTKATIDQQAKDVTVFLAWAAEPKLEERKNMGLKVILFLIVLSALFYAAKRKVWADVH